MNNIKRCLRLPAVALLLLLAATTVLVAAPLHNVPVTLRQPDGTVLQGFVSGDEYYNWIHDQNGYTIIADPATGYYTYAVLSAGVPVASPHIVGRSDPFAAGLAKHALPSPETMAQRATVFPGRLGPRGAQAEGLEIQNSPTSGVLNNVVVFIRFSDEPEFGVQIAPYDAMFNANYASANSLYNYYQEVSYGQLSINTTFYPAANNGYVVSYQDSHPRGYYQPYNAATNPSGYNDSERGSREYALLVNAINAIAPSIPQNLVVDADNDGLVDNVCFIVSGAPTGWSSLLWPHMSSLSSQPVYINGRRVGNFNLQLQTSLGTSNVGVLAHEMFHSLGAPDLYHYSHDGLSPVYRWDLMEQNSNPPEHMSAYMKYKYGKWISTIPAITASGSYTLNPLTSSSGNAYRIDSPNSASEYFVVEFRRKIGMFEASLPGEGILVYRINPAYRGNAGGPPDEVYLFRPGGSRTVNGSPALANFNSSVNRTAINDTTDPSSFLTDGSLGGLDIYGVSAVGSTMTFSVAMPSLKLSKVTLSPKIPAGLSATGTVLLSTAAPAGGATISLSSDNTALQVPATVVVLSGARTASFTATTAMVSNPASVTVTASYSGVTQTAAVVLVPDVTPPSVTITSTGGLVAGQLPVAIGATDDLGVAGLQCVINGTNYGTEYRPVTNVTSVNVSFYWPTISFPDGPYSFAVVARDASGNKATSNTVSYTVDNTAPTVAVTAPSGSGPLSGTGVTLSANAADASGIAGVQFKLDGTSLGSEITQAPYSMTWDTTRFTNGAHTVTATARDLAGNITTATAATATVTNSTDFGISLPSGASNTVTVIAGGAATYTLALAPATGFTGPITLACTGAPAAATCSVAQSANVSGRDATNVTITVVTTARNLANARPFGLNAVLWAMALLSGIVFVGRRKNGPGSMLVVLLLAACLASGLAMTACGGGGGSSNRPAPVPTGTPTGNYTITVTGTTSAGSHSYDLRLLVN